MDYYYWTLELVPTVGWTVKRWRKRRNLWAVIELQYDGLMHNEAIDVLDADSSYVLLTLALVQSS